MVGRWDFTYEEWSILLRLYRHEGAAPTDEVDQKLRKLGLSEGSGLTDTGRRLVENELLMERRNRLQL